MPSQTRNLRADYIKPIAGLVTPYALLPRAPVIVAMSGRAEKYTCTPPALRIARRPGRNALPGSVWFY